MPKPISTRTSTRVIRPSGTERRHPGNGTRVLDRINEATCASPTRILIVVTAIKRHARLQRRLRKSSGKVLEEGGLALTRAGFARTYEDLSRSILRGSVLSSNERMSETARALPAAGRNR